MALKECTKKEQANSYELEVNVDGETFGNAVNRVYKKQVKSINIPGFRKGKAPRHVIEKMYGSEVFYEDAMQDCYPDALYEAAKEAGIEGFDEHLEGTTAFAFSAEDAVAPAKVICEFIKKNKLDENEVLTVKVGTVEGKVIDVNEVKALAALPSLEELIAKALGSMNAPISNTVNVLQGIIRNAVYVLEAVRAQKESA